MRPDDRLPQDPPAYDLPPGEDPAYDLNLLHAEESGPDAGEPVLLLHGWGSSAALMRPIADGLADTYRVYNLDLPGHGQSPPPDEAWGVPEYARLVARFLAAGPRAPITIIGHSNGGRIALYMATTPGMASLLRRLVLVSPSGITPRRSGKYYVKRYTAQALKAPFTILPQPLRSHGLDWVRHTLPWKLISSADYQKTTGVMRETLVKTVNFHLDDRVDRVAVPTLLFWGENDRDISRRQMDVLAERIPDAGLVILQEAGHYGYLDDPDTFLAATRYFLTHS